MSHRDPLTGDATLHEHPVRDVPAAERAPVETPPCLVCRGETARPVLAVEGLGPRVVVCSGCGLGFFHPMPNPEDVRRYYPDAYYGEPGAKFQSAVERLVRIVGARHVAFLSRGLDPGARVLDVGCGRGVVLGPLSDRGFEVHGVEISEEAARGADSRAQVRVAPDLASAGYEAGTFDEVLIWHVLEHVWDPRATLDEAHRILRPGGRLIVAVPNFSSLQAKWSGSAWFHLDLPRHLFHFPLTALRRLIDDVGFDVLSEHHFSLRQNPFGWVQSALNRFESLPRNGLYTMLHRRSHRRGPFDPVTRAKLWLGLALLTPLAFVASAVETVMQSGATVHVVARKRMQ